VGYRYDAPDTPLARKACIAGTLTFKHIDGCTAKAS
jgi:hypothetical protein